MCDTDDNKICYLVYFVKSLQNKSLLIFPTFNPVKTENTFLILVGALVCGAFILIMNYVIFNCD